MSSHLPADQMHPTGILLSRLVCSAVVGVLILAVGFVRRDASPGAPTDAALVPFVNDVAPYFSFLILAAETVALVLLVVGVARWPVRIICSPRWVLSALGIVFVAVAILAVIYAGIVTAISLP